MAEIKGVKEGAFCPFTMRTDGPLNSCSGRPRSVSGDITDTAAPASITAGKMHDPIAHDFFSDKMLETDV